MVFLSFIQPSPGALLAAMRHGGVDTHDEAVPARQRDDVVPVVDGVARDNPAVEVAGDHELSR